MVLSVNRSGGGGMLERGPLRQKPVEGEDNGKEEPPKAENCANRYPKGRAAGEEGAFGKGE